MTPSTAYPPALIGELKIPAMEELLMRLTNRLGLGRLIRLSGIADRIAVDTLSRTPFTQLANLTGQPAMSVPLHWSDDNLPFGVQFIAPLGDEALLFRVASQLERARPWFKRNAAGL